jgi:DNA adenine methylase
LVCKVRSLLPELQSPCGTYFEPFLGSGAMFFALKPTRSVLNDLNADLINVFRVIKESPKQLERSLKRCQVKHSKEFYYSMRKQEPTDPLKAAVRMLYLNRTCFNGLYRVNIKGKFNVPMGSKTSVMLPTDNFSYVSERLQRASLRTSDFASVISKAGAGDLVFADPPYTVNHNLNGFLRYNENLFSWEDQKRLHDSASAAIRRGAQVIVTNADHASIRSLYDQARFKLHVVERHSKISSSNIGRKAITELVIVSKNVKLF